VTRLSRFSPSTVRPARTPGEHPIDVLFQAGDGLLLAAEAAIVARAA
jgi:hypothetical protein